MLKKYDAQLKSKLLNTQAIVVFADDEAIYAYPYADNDDGSVTAGDPTRLTGDEEINILGDVPISMTVDDMFN